MQTDGRTDTTTLMFTFRNFASVPKNEKFRHVNGIRTPSNTTIFNFKGKSIPLQAWTGPEGSRMSRLSNFKTVGT